MNHQNTGGGTVATIAGILSQCWFDVLHLLVFTQWQCWWTTGAISCIAFFSFLHNLTRSRANARAARTRASCPNMQEGCTYCPGPCYPCHWVPWSFHCQLCSWHAARSLHQMGESAPTLLLYQMERFNWVYSFWLMNHQNTGGGIVATIAGILSQCWFYVLHLLVFTQWQCWWTTGILHRIF